MLTTLLRPLAVSLSLLALPAAASGPRIASVSDGSGGGGVLAAGGAALVDQPDDGTGHGLASQSFIDLPDYSTYFFDDFVVPTARTWDIASFHADGAYESGAVVPDSYAFEIHADAGGVPACASALFAITVFPGDPGLVDSLGVFDYCPGGTLVTLGPGRYWLSVSVAMDYEFRGQWFWSSHSIPHASGGSAVADNPGGAFGIPPCAPIAAFDYDVAFALGGLDRPTDEKACRAGNVNAGAGAVANVLAVGGSSGDAICREVVVTAGVPVTVSIALPPAGGSGNFVLWTLDGEPSAATVTPIRYRPQSGSVHELGLGCLCLPANNGVTPGSCACPITFPTGRVSRAVGAGVADLYCLEPRSPLPKAPTSFQQTFPTGTFTLGGLVADPGSASTKPISIANWIVIRSN